VDGKPPPDQKEEMLKELRVFSKEYSPWHREETAKVVRALPKDKRREALQEFGQEVTKALGGFRSSAKIRDINSHTSHLFVHTIALESTGRANTTGNNQVVDTTALAPEEAIKLVLGGGLSLSCSAIPKDPTAPKPDRSFAIVKDGTKDWFGTGRHDAEGSKTMYPFGLVLGKGTILAAYRNDAGSLIEAGRTHRKSKYDRRTKLTAIQEDIEPSIANALETHTRFSTHEDHGAQRMGRDLNELVISHTEAQSFYVNLDDPIFAAERGHRSDSYRLAVLKMGKEVEEVVGKFPNLPILVEHGGKIEEFSRGREGQLVSPSGHSLEEILMASIEQAKPRVTEIVSPTTGSPHNRGFKAFEGIRAHMWASGELRREQEAEYIEAGWDEESLLVPDTNGDTALHTAARTGRDRHVPKELLEKYADLPGANGDALGDLIETRPLDEIAKEEADLRGVKLLPLKGGPRRFKSHEGKPIWALGNTPGGGFLCCDERGSSFACKLDWHVGAILKDYYLKAEQKGDMESATEIKELVAAAPIQAEFFSSNWINQHELAKELEAFSKTQTPELGAPEDPDLALTAVLASNAEPGPTPMIKEAQNSVRGSGSWKELLPSLSRTTAKIKAWFPKKDLGMSIGQ
jgi:hypothetical protein